MAELAYRTGLQPSEYERLTVARTEALLRRVRELHRDDVDLLRACAEVAGGGKRFR